MTKVKAMKAVIFKVTKRAWLANGYKLIDISVLANSISKFSACKSCKKTDCFDVKEDCKLKRGLSETLILSCRNCLNKILFSTSRKTNVGHSDINIRSVLSSQTMGHAGLETFCGMMILTPPVEKSSCNDINKLLHKRSNELAEKYLNDAAQRLILHTTIAENPGNIEVTDKDKLIAKVGVTVDGTRQKRRHSSKMGVVFVISIDTGEVLDYDVRSLFCHECTSHSCYGWK